MNCAELFLRRALEAPGALALYTPAEGEVSFGSLQEAAARVQKHLRAEGLRPGDGVLLVDFPGPRLFASVIAILASGATVILVEPWMPIEKIERVIRQVSPKFFVSNLFGKLWGARVSAVRAIPRRVSAARAAAESLGGSLVEGFRLEHVDPATPGVITFTTGTTGDPKGVVRTQGYLVAQYQVFSRALELERWAGPDLCVFANFALANLAAGRGSIIVPSNWNPAALKKLDELPSALRPESLSCGPAFLSTLMRHARVPSLRSIHVGGALADIELFEKGFGHWPEAHWTHVYGSSECEPVAISDARESARLSREEGRFQMLCLGKPVAVLEHSIEGDQTWVTGPHVCPAYVGNARETELYKRRDASWRTWHQMGDRIRVDERGTFWYAGRSQQPAAEFELEQSIYSHLRSSAAFVSRDTAGGLHLLGEGLRGREGELQEKFPELSSVREARVFRDRRHRARIDRAKSLTKKGVPWAVG